MPFQASEQKPGLFWKVRRVDLHGRSRVLGFVNGASQASIERGKARHQANQEALERGTAANPAIDAGNVHAGKIRLTCWRATSAEKYFWMLWRPASESACQRIGSK